MVSRRCGNGAVILASKFSLNQSEVPLKCLFSDKEYSEHEAPPTCIENKSYVYKENEL